MASRKMCTFARLVPIFAVTFITAALIAIPLLEARHNFDGNNPSRKMEGVEEVNSENYFDLVGRNRFVLLEFYVDWCRYCREFASLYDEFGKYVQARSELQQRLVVGKVNALNEALIQRQYNVSSYPTVILVPPNKHTGVVFTENRNFNQLLNFVEREMVKKEYAVTE
ncbi:conserved hypothetical protein [Leishmania major strain Friedlin]|uniref:Thioredoxin domain-containing protein n=1 Tax=Leishmania major TaxID=5664 RepID=Q4Q9C7_LEIMA|nr:conserved hypothetical protein [Leishmania major strain Friedlin]CAG9576360.1 Thioredoxin_-_putative [Leishmania major strain Friedlin]CAJ04840.1 conserved hypothetical protein [Leishmania major strain Friedlin]|eukprot:XP_001684071.1 conserved hypothetical protein [Leishmania major strain Friedlin]